VLTNNQLLGKAKFKKTANDEFSFHKDLHAKYENYGEEEDDAFMPFRTVEDDHDHGFGGNSPTGGQLKPHLRPRSMTERVANLLEMSHATGKTGDLTKSMGNMGSLGEDDEEESEDEEEQEHPEFESMTTWDNRRKIVHHGFTYYVWSEKKETLSMRDAENDQVRKLTKN